MVFVVGADLLLGGHDHVVRQALVTLHILPVDGHLLLPGHAVYVHAAPPLTLVTIRSHHEVKLVPDRALIKQVLSPTMSSSFQKTGQ